jgi:RsiW-degrading membrane proteinase PrsW (M82 family)
MNFIILLIMAIAPGLLIGYYIYLKDVHDKEPFGLIAFGVLLGAISFFVSIGLGLLLRKYTHIEQGDVIHQMIKALIFVGLVEEGSKFLFLRGVLYYNKNFTEPFDGIVYAVLIGMGFATTENLFYVFNGSGGTALIRMFTAVPAHGVFAVIMGFFIGEAKVFKTSSGLYSGLALGLAVFVHGYYDYFLFLPSIRGLWMQAVVGLIIFVVLTHFAIKLRREETIEPD